MMVDPDSSATTQAAALNPLLNTSILVHCWLLDGHLGDPWLRLCGSTCAGPYRPGRPARHLFPANARINVTVGARCHPRGNGIGPQASRHPRQDSPRSAQQSRPQPSVVRRWFLNALDSAIGAMTPRLALALALPLRDGDSEQLAESRRSKSADLGLAKRARIVLLASEGSGILRSRRRSGRRGPQSSSGVPGTKIVT